MTLDVSQLADLPALQQLARALWHNGSIRGAALMVGAGFSKNAVFQAPDTKEPPNWWELIEELVKQLYPTDEFTKPQEALRIAEEYRAYYGQATLDGYIRSRFPDRAWLPGALHAQALKLPWSDILTTNWDTLLERAADDVLERFYEVVRTEVDIPQTRSPRIVKLHGSIGDKDPIIFAAEDYRAYPNRHAAFVNLARQVFVENDICLLGFSGNDPNFLEWAGWVRDHLGGHARRIYLAGYLNLSVSARKLLEAQNIAPIDFTPLVKHLPKKDRHRAATEAFLEFLRKERPGAPHKWVRHDLKDYALQQVSDIHEKPMYMCQMAIVTETEAPKKLMRSTPKKRKKYPCLRNTLAKSRIERADALNIASKIGCDVRAGGGHNIATLHINGRLILTFGIRNGAKSGHGHLCGSSQGDLKLSETKVVALARCTLSRDEYFEILRARGIIPA